jgi:hypothetical protein
MAFGVDHRSNSYNLYVDAAREGLDSLFDLTLISFIANTFGAYHYCLRVGALMHRISGPFASRKPPLRRKKNEDQNDYTQKIPLPGVSRVVPEEDLLQCGSQASHVVSFASKQPQDSWLAGRLILAHYSRTEGADSTI